MNKKKLFWAFASILIAVFTIQAVFSQNQTFSFQALCQIVKEANKFWLAAAFVCMFGFIWFEGIALKTLLSMLNHKAECGQGLLYSGADIYFSSITPSATGGQPASAYFMIKDGIPAAAATAVLLANLVIYTLVLLILGIINLFFHFAVFQRFGRISQVLIVVGYFMLLGCALIFYLLLRKPEILTRLCNKFFRVLEALHLLNDVSKYRIRLEQAMQDYAVCARLLFGKWQFLAKVFFWNTLQRLSQFAVSFMVFMAMGQTRQQAMEALTVQCFVAVGTHSVPIPGAMGAADFMLLDGLRQLMDRALIIHAELLCRGITFYGSVITGFLIVVIGYVKFALKGMHCRKIQDCQ